MRLAGPYAIRRAVRRRVRQTDSSEYEQNTEMPLVSVLLPVFNAARTLPAAIASVLSQTYRSWELLVLDDGSSDGSLEVVRNLRDGRIRILEGEHLGLPAQLNRGVRHARGVFCARMDADDLAYPRRLQRQVEFLESHPEVDLVSTSIGVFHSDGSLVGIRRTRETHAELTGKAWASIPMAHPTWMGRTAWFKSHPYRENMRGMEDRDLLTRTFASSVFAGLPEVLLAYREDTISLRKQFSVRRETLRHLLSTAAPATAILLGAAQTYRFMEEVGACTTGSQQTLQRKRVVPPTEEERQSFDCLWSGVRGQVEQAPAGSNR